MVDGCMVDAVCSDIRRTDHHKHFYGRCEGLDEKRRFAAHQWNIEQVEIDRKIKY